MNETVKTIVALLEQGKPELQVAAAQILGELRPKDAAILRALAAGLDRSPVLARFCLDALAKVGSDAALAIVARSMTESEALADHASHLLVEVGTAAHGVLARLYPQVVGEQRARILAVLARHLDRDAVQVFIQALLSPETAAAAAALLRAEAAQIGAGGARQLREGLERQLAGALPEACQLAALQVLAAVDPAGARQIFLRHTGPTFPLAVRVAAFHALRGSKLTGNQVAGMMALLDAPAERELHEAVREVLVRLPELPAGHAAALRRMLASRQSEQRLFALRMLRTAGGADWARTCIKLLDHDDGRYRAAAEEALAANKQAAEPLLKTLLATRSPDLAESCRRILTQQVDRLPPKVLRSTAERAVRLLSTNPRLGDMLLDIVLAGGSQKIAVQLVESAVRLRRAHRHAEALHLLARVASSPAGDDECRYQIALTKLLSTSDRDAEGGAPGNSTMGFFAALIRAGFPLFERLRREYSMTPELLLRVATHFAMAVGAERRFATQVLQHLATRSKGRASEEARIALRAVGT